MIQHEPIPEAFEKSRAAYLATLKDSPPTLTDRAIRLVYRASVALWSRFPGHLSLLCAIGLTFLVCRFAVSVEVPDGIIRGIVMVESGATWHDIGKISGKWKRGDAGEISHFQLSADALRQMKVSDKAERIASCSVLAESYARKFLVICYEKRGNWRDAVATYHRWSRYRSAGAREYAERVLNIADL